MIDPRELSAVVLTGARFLWLWTLFKPLMLIASAGELIERGALAVAYWTAPADVRDQFDAADAGIDRARRKILEELDET